jgi:hypothetical protein
VSEKYECEHTTVTEEDTERMNKIKDEDSGIQKNRK